MRAAPRLSAQHRDRGKTTGPRHRQRDVAEFRQDMARVRAVAPIGPIERGHPVEMLVDGPIHLAAQHIGDRLAAERPIAFAPFQPVRLHALHQFEAMTVDTVQGSTATEHIHAPLAGPHAIHGFKAYTAASRHERTTWIVVDEASERRHLASRSMIGQRPEIGEPDVWRQIGENLGRQPQKASALDMLHAMAETPRQAQPRMVRQGPARV